MEELLEYQEGKRVWFTSDLHLGHDKEFIWHARGFNSVAEMNEAIIANLQAMVGDEDRLFILGDLMLGGAAADPGYWLQQLPGKVEIILGNHDTNKREEAYRQFFPDAVFDARRLRYKARDGKTYHFYLSHYPTLTSNYDDATKPLSARLIGLYGHTHQTTSWYIVNDSGDVHPFMYHIGIDAHNNRPVEIEDIITEIKACYKTYEMEKEN